MSMFSCWSVAKRKRRGSWMNAPVEEEEEEEEKDNLRSNFISCWTLCECEWWLRRRGEKMKEIIMLAELRRIRPWTFKVIAFWRTYKKKASLYFLQSHLPLLLLLLLRHVYQCAINQTGHAKCGVRVYVWQLPTWLLYS